jgi:hypothetical protein
VLAYLKGQPAKGAAKAISPDHGGAHPLEAPYPILRHHFGLPTMEATLRGIEQIAEAKALDVISLGIDQDAQENFFHPERQDPRRTGRGRRAGAQPGRLPRAVRSQPPRQFPLLRTYSGTDDFHPPG